MMRSHQVSSDDQCLLLKGLLKALRRFKNSKDSQRLERPLKAYRMLLKVFERDMIGFVLIIFRPC